MYYIGINLKNSEIKMIICIVGKPGSGKTLVQTWIAIRMYQRGDIVYSNFTIKNPFIDKEISRKIKSKGDLDHAHDGWLIIDEAAKLADSRQSMSSSNQFSTKVLQLNRKRGLSLVYSAQDAFMIDIRLRENTDYVLMPQIVYIINGKETKIKQDLFEPINPKLLLPFAYLKVYFYHAFVFYGKQDKLTYADAVDVKTFKMSDIVTWYNTKEEIMPLFETEKSKGQEFEELCFKLLRDKYPNDAVILNEDSGFDDDDTFDLEWQHEGKLKIIDCKSLHKGRYIEVAENKKDLRVKARHIETKRDADVYLMFDHNDDIWLLNWKHTYPYKPKTIDIKRVQKFLEKP